VYLVIDLRGDVGNLLTHSGAIRAVERRARWRGYVELSHQRRKRVESRDQSTGARGHCALCVVKNRVHTGGKRNTRIVRTDGVKWTGTAPAHRILSKLPRNSARDVGVDELQWF